MVDRICAVGRSSGQMTVEFVAALPVLLAVAAISVNALAFFGWCAAFDDDFRDSVSGLCRFAGVWARRGRYLRAHRAGAR